MIRKNEWLTAVELEEIKESDEVNFEEGEGEEHNSVEAVVEENSMENDNLVWIIEGDLDMQLLGFKKSGRILFKDHGKR